MRGRLVIDIVPTRGHDESGMHGAIWEHFDAKQFELRADKPLTLVSYSASQIPTAYIEPTSIGAELIPMPMFLDPDWYINVPLADSYNAAFRGIPHVGGTWWRIELTESSCSVTLPTADVVEECTAELAPFCDSTTKKILGVRHTSESTVRPVRLLVADSSILPLHAARNDHQENRKECDSPTQRAQTVFSYAHRLLTLI